MDETSGLWNEFASKIGTEVGQVSQEALNNLISAKAEAVIIWEKVDATEAEVANATSDLANAIGIFTNAIVKESTTSISYFDVVINPETNLDITNSTVGGLEFNFSNARLGDDTAVTGTYDAYVIIQNDNEEVISTEVDKVEVELKDGEVKNVFVKLTGEIGVGKYTAIFTIDGKASSAEFTIIESV